MSRRFPQELVQPFSHFLTSPAEHSPVVHAQCPVGDYQMFIDADNLAEAFTRRTGSQRRVEREHLVVRFFKLDAVSFKFGAEHMQAGVVRQVKTEHARAVAFVHGRFGRIRQSADGILAVVAAHTVYQQIHLVAFVVGIVLNAYHFAVHLQSGESLLHVHVQLFRHGSSVAGKDGGQHRVACTLRIRQHAVHNVFHAVLLHQLSAYGRIGFSHPCEKQTQVLINLGRCTYGRTWVAARHLLFDGDGRRNPLDKVTFRFAHTSEKLAGVGRQAFHIASLPFGIQRVECQRRLSRTGQSGNDYQLVAGDTYVDVFQVIHPGTLYGNKIIF